MAADVIAAELHVDPRRVPARRRELHGTVAVDLQVVRNLEPVREGCRRMGNGTHLEPSPQTGSPLQVGNQAIRKGGVANRRVEHTSGEMAMFAVCRACSRARDMRASSNPCAGIARDPAPASRGF